MITISTAYENMHLNAIIRWMCAVYSLIMLVNGVQSNRGRGVIEGTVPSRKYGMSDRTACIHTECVSMCSIIKHPQSSLQPGKIGQLCPGLEHESQLSLWRARLQTSPIPGPAREKDDSLMPT